MWAEKKIEEYLKEILNEQRYIHSLGVRDAAGLLAVSHGEDEEIAKLAGLVHDCAKNLSSIDLLKMAEEKLDYIDTVSKDEPQLLHGFCGSIMAQRIMGINNEYLLDSIKYHTTGRVNMTTLDKIIYLADYIEPSRVFPGVDYLRELSYLDVDKAMIFAYDNTIKYIISKGKLIHMETIKGRNDILYKMKFK